MVRARQADQPELPESIRLLDKAIARALSEGNATLAIRLLRRLIAVTEPEAALQELWAEGQRAVGNLLMQTSSVNESRAREAIASYHAALRVFTHEAFPVQYATVQNNLGNTFRDLPTAGIEERESNLDRAIAAYQDALAVRSRAVDPYSWAEIQNNLGMAHTQRRHNGGAHLDRAMACFLRAMLVFHPFDPSRRHQELARRLGDAFVKRMALTPSGRRPEVLTTLAPVVRALAEAHFLPEMPSGAGSKDADEPDGDCDSWRPDPDLFAEYRRDLYQLLPLPQLVLLASSRAAGEDPERRVEFLRIAARRRDVVLPRLRAQLLDELGTTLLSLASGAADATALQEEAIGVLHAALDARSRDEDPYAWGSVRNHLAAAYGDRTAGDRAENMECAIEHAVAAISTRRGGSPELAVTTAQLGQLYRDRPLGSPRRNSDRAIACFEVALRVWTKERWPYDWARTKNSLGTCLVRRNPGNAQALEMAIHVYEEALTVLTEKQHPYEWAGVTANLSIALVDRVAGNRAPDVERAIAGHQAVLGVHTREHHPEDWAHAQHSLGNAYRARVAGMKDDNLRLAAQHFRAALEVLTPESRPFDHRAVAGVLGQTEADRGRWLAAHEAFASAAAAGDLLLADVATGPHGFDDVVRQGHEVGELDAYALVRLGRLFEAVEAVERGRTRWMATSLTDPVGAPVTVAAIARGVDRPVIYLLASPWGGLALAVRKSASEPEVLSWDLPGLTDGFVGELVEQRLSDGSGRIIGGYAAAQEGTGLNQLMHQWPGASFAEKAATLHSACHATAIDGTLDAAAQDVLALNHPGLAELLHSPMGSLSPANLSRLTATLHHSFLHFELLRCQAGLADVVTAPLAAALAGRGISSIVLIPCGLLPGLPITAATVDGDETFADRHVLTVAPSARGLLTWSTPGADDGEGVYTLGDPRPTHQELRWGEAEALTVAELAGNPTRARVHEAATRNWLIESMHTGQVVLASCHGQFDSDDFLRSRLLLGNGEDLTLGDVLEEHEDFAGLRVIILSACQMAVMNIARGAHGEVRSLAAAILRAGVRAVVAPLWAVDDRATYLLMVRFAQEWLPRMATEGPSAALARAQSWLRHVTHRELVAWEGRSGVARDAPFSAAARGRGTRYTAAEAVHLTSGLALHGAAEEPNSAPYADPIFWAAFQVYGQ